MKVVIFFLIAQVICIGCSSQKPQLLLQMFSPVAIDVNKVNNGDYSEIVDIVNKNAGDETHLFGDPKLMQGGEIFVYINVFSLSDDGACFRVTIDRHRSSVVNMQPDCPVNE